MVVSPVAENHPAELHAEPGLETEQGWGSPGSESQEVSPTNRLSGEAFAAALREQPKLRQALVARYGVDVGEQAVAAAMAWAWEHQDRLVGVSALRAYLFRVGQSSRSAAGVASTKEQPRIGATIGTLTIESARVNVPLIEGAALER